jgi:hypothetical protein
MEGIELLEVRVGDVTGGIQATDGLGSEVKAIVEVRLIGNG